MTREEQIIATSKEYYEKPNLSMRVGFIEGAKWADANPQFSKEEFIEKACEWLGDNTHFYVSAFTGTLDENNMIEDFKKAMEE